MNEKTGKFLPVDGAEHKQALEKLQKEMGPGNKAHMPTLEEGETVAIKGVDFKVTKIKMFSGYVALRMIAKGE